MICGENELTKSLNMSVEKTCGCGREIQPSEIYRCVDCAVPFHRTCLRMHFAGCKTSQRSPMHPDYLNVAANIWQSKHNRLFYYSDDSGFHGPFQFAIEAQEALKRIDSRIAFETIVRIANKGTMSGYDATMNTYLDPTEQEMWTAWQAIWKDKV